MPKRTSKEKLEHLMRKVRKLERKMRDSSESANDLPPPPDNGDFIPTMHELLIPSDWLPQSPDAEELDFIAGEASAEINVPADDALANPVVSQEEPSTSETQQPKTPDIELETDVLEILGDDPSLDEKRGKEIRNELVRRFEHIATEGLSKEIRKELILKYPLPANCEKINAPKVNPEVKIAVPENFIKRDKGIEEKQKQMASAISCLGDIITMHLNSKDKDNETLQKLMDLGRLLCDMQHSDSMTRRSLILFSLKKDLKDHLNNSKIDSLLFSETLADTLKQAKSISKTGVELKADFSNINAAKRQKVSNSKNLNRKAPGPAYRQPGPSRSYVPAAPRAQLPQPPPPPTHSWGPSWRRPLPPLAPPAQARRRY